MKDKNNLKIGRKLQFKSQKSKIFISSFSKINQMSNSHVKQILTNNQTETTAVKRKTSMPIKLFRIWDGMLFLNCYQ